MHSVPTFPSASLPRGSRLGPLALALLLAAVALPAAHGAQAGLPPAAPAAPGQGVLFERNLGQWDAKALFRAHAAGYDAFVTATGLAMLQLREPAAPDGPLGAHPAPAEAWATFVELVGSNPDPLVTTDAALPFPTHYLHGSDPAAWVRDVPSFRQVTLHDVYPGIDLAYHADAQGQLKYDFLVRPGADAGRIQQRFTGQAGLATDADGGLLVQTGLGTLRQGVPLTWQADGAKVANHYAVAGDTVTFALAPHDPTQLLVIDPLLYSTYLGGAGDDSASDVAVDASGNAYVTGWTRSTDFPIQAGYQSSYGGDYYDLFVAKLNPAAATLVYSTFVGGSDADESYGIAVDSSGNAYVAGVTWSTNYPTRLPYQSALSPGGEPDAFVTKLNAAGSDLVYSTYLGGTDNDGAHDLALDSLGNAYLVGWSNAVGTNVWDFPLAGAYQSANAGGYDLVVAKLGASGSTLSYSTYLGGSGWDGAFGSGIAVDASGNAYLAGSTDSTNYPLASPYSSTAASGFITKLSATGGSLTYSTYFPGSAEAVAVDASGNAYVVGETTSSTFPVASAYQATLGGGTDGFVSKMNAAGSALLFSTYLGGGSTDEATGVALDASGNAYVSGDSSSTNFPVTANAYQTARAGPIYDGIFAKFSSGGTGLYATYFGTGGDDNAFKVAPDAAGNAFVAGWTAATDLPIAGSAFRATKAGGQDAYVAKLSPGVLTAPTTPAVACGSPMGVALTWAAPANNDGGAVTGYKVYRNDGSGYALAGSPTGTSFTDLPPWRTAAYPYRVVAVNANGEGSPAALSRATCDAQAPSITGNTIAIPWRNTIPSLSGLTWQDTYSGLNQVQYTIGTTSGNSNVQTITSLPSQPTSGQTTAWPMPAFTPAALAQGMNYVNTRATDRAGVLQSTNGAITIQYDSVAPTVSGNPQATTWTRTIPTLGGVTWQDATSGLQTTVQYAVGTTPTGTEVSGWTALPAAKQPVAGQTAAYTPSWSPAALANGLNYVHLAVPDRAGNLVTTYGAYTVQYDTVAPTIGAFSSSTHPNPARFYQATSASASWSASDPLSGVAGYYVRAPATGSCPSGLSASPWQTGTTTSASGLGPFGQYRLCVQPKDNAGNAGAVYSLNLNVNTIAPAFGAVQPAPGSANPDPRAPILVVFDNSKGGADPSGLVTVDPALVELDVDGVDVVALYASAPECAPVRTPACPVEVDGSHVKYTPPAPWSAGAHSVAVQVGDTTIPPLTAGTSWSFTTTVGVPGLGGLLPACIDGVDNDGDGRADYLPAALGGGDPQCTNPIDNDEGN